MKYITLLIVALAALLYFGGCNYKNVDTIKANAEATWEASGFRVVGYEGYQIGSAFTTPGGKVWYVVERQNDSSVRYHGLLSKWGDEFHIYNLQAIDAIKPN